MAVADSVSLRLPAPAAHQAGSQSQESLEAREMIQAEKRRLQQTPAH
jgi:hypothetical protein